MTKKAKWFKTGRPLNWSKDDGQAHRRRNALNSRHGSLLKTARALMALSNVTRDSETKQKAKSDALYFYRKHNAKQRKAAR